MTVAFFNKSGLAFYKIKSLQNASERTKKNFDALSCFQENLACVDCNEPKINLYGSKQQPIVCVNFMKVFIFFIYSSCSHLYFQALISLYENVTKK